MKRPRTWYADEQAGAGGVDPYSENDPYARRGEHRSPAYCFRTTSAGG